MNITEASRSDITEVTIQEAEIALNLYRLQTGKLPATAEGFAPLLEVNILKETPLDGWGYPLQYKYNSNKSLPITIYSVGQDVFRENQTSQAKFLPPLIILTFLLSLSILLNVIQLMKRNKKECPTDA